MKKIIVIVLMLSLIFIIGITLVTGCKKSETPAPAEKSAPQGPTPIPDEPAPIPEESG